MMIEVAKIRKQNEGIVSRSQAKLLLANCKEAKTIVLDFSNIDSIGQGFTDQVFRVFKASHPEVKIEVVNACSAVKESIAVCEANARENLKNYES